jgi:hypothetical protein
VSTKRFVHFADTGAAGVVEETGYGQPPPQPNHFHCAFGQSWPIYSAATVGNPHCVILRDRVSVSETCALGPLIETAPPFPHRTNVQFLEVRDRQNLHMEIWERGAGYTLASGRAVVPPPQWPIGWGSVMRPSRCICRAGSLVLRYVQTSRCG